MNDVCVHDKRESCPRLHQNPLTKTPSQNLHRTGDLINNFRIIDPIYFKLCPLLVLYFFFHTNELIIYKGWIAIDQRFSKLLFCHWWSDTIPYLHPYLFFSILDSTTKSWVRWIKYTAPSQCAGLTIHQTVYILSRVCSSLLFIIVGLKYLAHEASFASTSVITPNRLFTDSTPILHRLKTDRFLFWPFREKYSFRSIVNLISVSVLEV